MRVWCVRGSTGSSLAKHQQALSCYADCRLGVSTKLLKSSPIHGWLARWPSVRRVAGLRGSSKEKAWQKLNKQWAKDGMGDDMGNFLQVREVKWLSCD